MLNNYWWPVTFLELVLQILVPLIFHKFLPLSVTTWTKEAVGSEVNDLELLMMSLISVSIMGLKSALIYSNSLSEESVLLR